MTQAEIDRAICRATGETRERIGQMGFSLLTLRAPRPRRRFKRRAKNRHSHRSRARQLAATG